MLRGVFIAKYCITANTCTYCKYSIARAFRHFLDTWIRRGELAGFAIRVSYREYKGVFLMSPFIWTHPQKWKRKGKKGEERRKPRASPRRCSVQGRNVEHSTVKIIPVSGSPIPVLVANVKRDKRVIRLFLKAKLFNKHINENISARALKKYDNWSIFKK